MAISNSMEFRIDTLIDITETNARRQDNDKFAYKQQANFQTMLQKVTNYECSQAATSSTCSYLCA